MLIFGHAGYPVVLFPTSRGRFYENKDFGLIGAASWFLEQGLIKIYCPDGIDNDSWYNRRLHPRDRVKTHLGYENMIREEVVGRARHETGQAKVAMAGCSFGAFHATLFALKHPWLVGYLFNMGGSYDIRGWMDGYYDELVYFNNPVDFLPNLHHPDLYRMGITLGMGEWDFCRPANERLSGVLHGKGIRHWLDIRAGYSHDWNPWKVMFPDYLASIYR